MKGKGKPKALEKIKKKVKSCDSVRYLVGQALFEEDAEQDIRWLIAEVEQCWKEIENLNESLILLTRKTTGALKHKAENS